jgi:hypothetical protein
MSGGRQVPRSFRFYVKKRGTRRTDSRLLGNLARIVFFSTLFLAGLGIGGYLLATLIVPEWRVNHRFLEARCIVVTKRLLEIENPSGEKRYRPEFQIQYTVEPNFYDIRTYDIARAFSSDREAQDKVLRQFEVGREYPCWYNPADPAEAVLARGYTWSAWLLLILPLSFVVGGVGGLVITLLGWINSAERQAVIAQRALPLELFASENPARSGHPTIPQHVALADSPGTHLAFRLPQDARSLWAIMALLAGSLAVLVAAGGFGTIAWYRYTQGNFDLWLSLFVGLLIVVGLAGVAISAQHLAKATSTGPTILEISDHPLYPGREYQLFLSQGGRAKLSKLSLRLVSDEVAIFRQGTNTRREAHRVVDVLIAQHQNIQLGRRHQFEARYAVHVPPRSMHSFRTAHNAIEWKLLVSGQVESGASFDRRFPIIVYPHCEAS